MEAKKQLNVESINTNKKLGLKSQIVNFRNIDNLPYVLNPLILLKLIHKFLSGVEIDNNHINSKLQ